MDLDVYKGRFTPHRLDVGDVDLSWGTESNTRAQTHLSRKRVCFFLSESCRQQKIV